MLKSSSCGFIVCVSLLKLFCISRRKLCMLFSHPRAALIIVRRIRRRGIAFFAPLCDPVASARKPKSMFQQQNVLLSFQLTYVSTFTDMWSLCCNRCLRFVSIWVSPLLRFIIFLGESRHQPPQRYAATWAVVRTQCQKCQLDCYSYLFASLGCECYWRWFCGGATGSSWSWFAVHGTVAATDLTMCLDESYLPSGVLQCRHPKADCFDFQPHEIHFEESINCSRPETDPGKGESSCCQETWCAG